MVPALIRSATRIAEPCRRAHCGVKAVQNSGPLRASLVPVTMPMAAISIVFVRHESEIRSIKTDWLPYAIYPIRATRCPKYPLSE
jgi:hypothetical protein